MVGVKDMMAIRETGLSSASAARDMAEQGHQCLEAKCQKLRFAYGGESLSILHCASILSLCPVVSWYVFL
jgi:hypothetical protein